EAAAVGAAADEDRVAAREHEGLAAGGRRRDRRAVGVADDVRGLEDGLGEGRDEEGAGGWRADPGGALGLLEGGGSVPGGAAAVGGAGGGAAGVVGEGVVGVEGGRRRQRRLGGGGGGGPAVGEGERRGEGE